MDFNPRLREGGDGIKGAESALDVISIHASAKEATINPEESMAYSSMISIHASAKEATIFRRDCNLSCFYFNPRLREGGDLVCRILFGVPANFNPRLREGGDKASTRKSTQVLNFNPRLREGGDQMETLKRRVLNISIHASAKEATYKPISSCEMYEFQSTPPRRRRPQHIVIPQLSCAYLVVTTFLSAIFSFISQYVVLFFLF